MSEVKEENCDFLEHLISLVKQNKILYEKQNKFYYNRRKKEKVWNDIATQTNKTPIECKNKWTALREKFIRELKKKNKPSIIGAGEEPQWELFSNMLFLKNVTKPRKPQGNDEKLIQYAFSSPVDEKLIQYPSSSPVDEKLIEYPSSSPVDEKLIQYPSSSPVDRIPFPFIEKCSTPPQLKKKTFDELCDQFGDIVSKMEKRLSAGPHTNSNSDADELFIRTALSMIQDLPSSAKDEIKSDIFNKIIEARRRFRYFS